MKRSMTLYALGFLFATSAATFAQMEKRSDELYGKAFATANPAVGTQVPDLVLCDIDGRPWALSTLKGSIVVVVKGGFT